ncbi:hypothetical protein D4764_08G0010220 [Takifugu flavidus]|uniref:Reverse transcriptase domain-containing protein n=1 Tax=Takifugu flavidus TaxID=433684 RepID=A0A5C6MQJ0_9TELE|nr:hypothetical protein D4764_08G0010220 [Takifugu flavidus]
MKDGRHDCDIRNPSRRKLNAAAVNEGPDDSCVVSRFPGGGKGEPVGALSITMVTVCQLIRGFGMKTVKEMTVFNEHEAFGPSQETQQLRAANLSPDEAPEKAALARGQKGFVSKSCRNNFSGGNVQIVLGGDKWSCGHQPCNGSKDPTPCTAHKPINPMEYRSTCSTRAFIFRGSQSFGRHPAWSRCRRRPILWHRTSGEPLSGPYQPKVGVDDAVIYLLQGAYSSLDRLNTTVWVMFFDFSSAFNTIRPRLLRAKLENMQMDAPLVSWIEDYLTADFQYHSETCHLQKYSDDTVIVGCVENGQEDEYRDLVESFVRWCRENLLQLNVTKTKEMVVDFRKSKSPPSPVCISGKDVEIFPSYRFLGVQLDNKLEWSTNTDAVYKKAMSRL